ncbi:alpha/beta hydrolase [Massilia sp. TS11]|uniref:PHA/PHB synthase family protein n=1 Tax=Massilia sp. TS11 TaxID=2908003 RepID=UPI001ED9D8DC|nr:alpha/beta fold hydrolase [Massilia sp. TS11]MCG2583978.1 alpha/beta fold hydrolase [Massilia sp. TS11]
MTDLPLSPLTTRPGLPLERLASAWQGVLDQEDPQQALAAARWDLILNAMLGRVTGNISPAAIGLAYIDWLSHLSLSPSKREELVLKAWKKLWRWQMYALRLAANGGNHTPDAIDPLPQDKRFLDPAWRRWPFNLLSQAFLLQQQWWHCATTGVSGVSQHHEDVVTFTVRQWLDMLAPSNFPLTNPVVLDTTLQRGGMNLWNGALRFAEDLRAAAQGEAPASEEFAVGRNLAITPGEVVFRNELIELIQYAPSTARVHSVPLLFVPAWIMKYYILDLSPANSLVKYLVDQGHTVYMISWKNPGEADRNLSLEDYRRLGIMAALDAIGAPKVNACGYCLGGTLLSIAAAAMARDGDQRLNSMTMLAAQVDFTEPGELSLFIDDSQVNFLEASMWQQGYLDTRQMAGAFQLLRSNDLIWSYRLRKYLLDLPDVQTDLMAWNADATRMPYRMHSEYLRQLFLRNDLASGRYRAGGKPVALEDIHVPIFAVGTVTDHVAPWRSVYKLHLHAEEEISFLLTTGGHNAGVVSPPGQPRRSYQLGTRARGGAYVDPDTWQTQTPQTEGSWWPAWTDWLGRHAGKRVAPPPMGASLGAAPGSYVLQR